MTIAERDRAGKSEATRGNAHESRLLAEVRPENHVNPTPGEPYDLVVIGAGTAGLVSAVGAGLMGAKVAICERARLGGDCLNFGCVPSKALLRAATLAHDAREMERHGIEADVRIDFAAVMDEVRRTRADIGPHDETVFSLQAQPRHLGVIGGGPVGCELAQAFARLGSAVTLLERGSRLLATEDADLAKQLAARLRDERITVELGAEVRRVERFGELRRVHLATGTIEVDALLVATGREVNLAGLELAKGGVETDEHGVIVDARLQTSNARVFAAGDVASRFRFTHAAEALARLATQNALLGRRLRASRLVIPWCTYLDPEIAHVGIHQRDADARHDVTTYALDLAAEVDRAIIDRDATGLARVHVDSRGRILGASVVTRHASELMGPVVLAMQRGTTLRGLGEAIVPYPTRAELWKRLADQQTQSWITGRLQAVLRWFIRIIGRL